MNRALPTSIENKKVEATAMKRKEGKGKKPTLVNIGILCLPRGKQNSSMKVKMEKRSFGSIGRLKNPSSILRYSQINGFAMSLQQKVRVKIPKVLVVKHPMQKTEKGAKGKKKKIKWTKPAGLLPKEIGSIFCNASRNKKTLPRDSSSSKNDQHGDADALEECMEERDLLILSGKKGSMFKTLLEDSVERLTLSKSCSFKNIPKISLGCSSSGSERGLDFASPAGRPTKQILEQTLKVQTMVLLLMQRLGKCRKTLTGHQPRGSQPVTASLKE